MAAGWSAANRAAGKIMTIMQLRIFRYKALIIIRFLERNLWTIVTRRNTAYKGARADVTVPEELIVSLVTVASESYPSELLSVNAFRARGAVFGGKLLCRSVALSAVAGDPAQRHWTTPFHHTSFGHRWHRSWPSAVASASGFLAAERLQPGKLLRVLKSLDRRQSP